MRQTPNALMLFAAGFGTRMGTLTANRPKPLIPVAGKPLIDHALDIATDAGIGNIVVNTHYLPDMIQAHLAGREITLSHEDDILETGGGLRNALPLLGPDPVFTLNTDAVWTGPNPLQTLAAAWDPANMDALLLLIPLAQAKGHKGKGDFIPDENGTLTRGAGLIYSGAQIIKTDALPAIPQTKFSLNLLWDEMIKSRRLFGIPHSGNWCDVGTPQGIEIAETMIGTRDV